MHAAFVLDNNHPHEHKVPEEFENKFQWITVFWDEKYIVVIFRFVSYE